MARRRVEDEAVLAEAPWVWPASNTREVDAAILQATPNWAECPGRYCVKRAFNAEDPSWRFILSVVYSERPTHHLITVTPDNTLCINGLFDECGWKTITELVEALECPPDPDRWPVPLTERVDCPWHGVDSSVHGWLHPPMSVPEAEAVLKAAASEGAFFISRRGEFGPFEFLLFMFVQGSANQHLIVPMEDGSGFHVNDTELGTGCKTLPELVEVLSKPHGSTWPVPLGRPIAPVGWRPSARPGPRAVAGAATAPAYATLSVAYPSTIGMFASPLVNATPTTAAADHLADSLKDYLWYHPDVQDTALAGRMMKSDGCRRGTFFVFPARPDMYEAGACIACIAYNDRPTYHLLTQKNGFCHFNGSPLANCRTVREVIQHLIAHEPTLSVPIKLGRWIPRGFRPAEGLLDPTPDTSMHEGPAEAAGALAGASVSTDYHFADASAVAEHSTDAATADSIGSDARAAPTDDGRRSKKWSLGGMGFGTVRRKRPSMYGNPRVATVANVAFQVFEI